MSLKIQFLGAAETVTGSRYLITYKDQKILVDCGLFQGVKNLRLKNWEDFPVNPREISAIILTHAHIDHSGYIPRLVKMGFRGKIYCTTATFALCKILLLDSGHLMEEEADFLNRHKKTKHDPALPLFSTEEAEFSLKFFETVELNKKFEINSDLSFQFSYVGHILGASSVVITAGDKKIGFTGDIGRMKDRMFYPPAPMPQVDYLITESTYGNRLHEKVDVLNELQSVVLSAVQKKGVILIPSFAVGRAQLLMYYLSILKKEKRIPDIPIFLNSPMATNVNALLLKFKEWHKLTDQECNDTLDIAHYISSVEESKELNTKTGPMIIISASGMLTGGRILHHIKAFASQPQNTILITGFQTPGTRGDSLLMGAKEIKIHGMYVPINAQVIRLPNMSQHADYEEIIQWFESHPITPKKVFVTHGDLVAADELRRRLGEEFNWRCIVPQFNESFELD